MVGQGLQRWFVITHQAKHNMLSAGVDITTDEVKNLPDRAATASLERTQHLRWCSVVACEVVVDRRFSRVGVIANRHGEIHRSSEICRISTCLDRSIDKELLALSERLGVWADRKPAVEVFRGPLDSHISSSGKPNRRPTGMMRNWRKRTLVDLPPAVPGDGVARPQCLGQSKALHQPANSSLERHAGRRELRSYCRSIARNADTKDQPPFAELIECCQLVRQYHGITKRR